MPSVDDMGRATGRPPGAKDPAPGTQAGKPGEQLGEQLGDQPTVTQDDAGPAALADALRAALLRRMIAMEAALPPGSYTEIKGQLGEGAALAGTFKLRDFAASVKDLAAIGGKAGAGPDVEDWSPLAGILGGAGDDDEDDDEDGDT